MQRKMLKFNFDPRTALSFPIQAEVRSFITSSVVFVAQTNPSLSQRVFIERALVIATKEFHDAIDFTHKHYPKLLATQIA